MLVVHPVARVRRPIDHLREIIPTGSGETEWVDAAQDYPELLSGPMLGYNITSATTDVLASERSAVSAGSPQTSMRLLMDIRRTITRSDVDKAQARLLLGNLRSPESRPVMVRSPLVFPLALCAQRSCLERPRLPTVEEGLLAASLLALRICTEMYFPQSDICQGPVIVSRHANKRC